MEETLYNYYTKKFPGEEVRMRIRGHEENTKSTALLPK
jgi:hypothetical protein